MKRALFTLSSAVVAAGAFGVAAFSSVFVQKYALPSDSPLVKAKCAVCHIGMTKKLNPYGEDMQKAMGGAKKLTPEVLAKIEELDSDKDGVKNLAEIKSGKMPGDPRIK